MRFSKKRREVLRMQYGGRCALCGDILPERGWHAEYLGKEYVSEGYGAVCTDCRTTKGNASPEAFRAILAEQVERARRGSINFRTALRFGLCHVKVEPVVFWFEKYQARYTRITGAPQNSASL